MTEERLAEIKSIIERAWNSGSLTSDVAEIYAPELVMEVERLQKAFYSARQMEIAQAVYNEKQKQEIARLRKALTQIHGVTSHEDNVAIFGDMAEIERIAKEALGNGD